MFYFNRDQLSNIFKVNKYNINLLIYLVSGRFNAINNVRISKDNSIIKNNSINNIKIIINYSIYKYKQIQIYTQILYLNIYKDRQYITKQYQYCNNIKFISLKYYNNSLIEKKIFLNRFNYDIIITKQINNNNINNFIINNILYFKYYYNKYFIYIFIMNIKNKIKYISNNNYKFLDIILN